MACYSWLIFKTALLWSDSAARSWPSLLAFPSSRISSKGLGVVHLADSKLRTAGKEDFHDIILPLLFFVVVVFLSGSSGLGVNSFRAFWSRCFWIYSRTTPTWPMLSNGSQVFSVLKMSESGTSWFLCNRFDAIWNNRKMRNTGNLLFVPSPLDKKIPLFVQAFILRAHCTAAANGFDLKRFFRFLVGHLFFETLQSKSRRNDRPQAETRSASRLTWWQNFSRWSLLESDHRCSTWECSLAE